MTRERPLMVFDGDCGFCRLWIERWRAVTGDRVEYRASQELGPELADVPAEAFAGSVQFFDKDGRRHDRAAAVFRSLATVSRVAKLAVWAYERVPGFAAVTNGAYGVVARNRMLFSRLTRLLWGYDVTPPTYGIATTLFLRLLGLIYAIAFVSFGVQARGLIGAHGILPIRDVLPQVAAALGADAWWQWPTLLWLNASDVMIFGLTWAGVACAVLVMLGMAQPLALAGAWAAYLSLTVAGQDFYSFQWDILLLEAGLLAVFVAPWAGRPSLAWRRPSRLGHFALVWLLFRLMFSSGIVKLSSGDPTWRNFTALDFHYWTQPLPNVLSWFAAQVPEWFQKLSCALVLGIEVVLPFFIFLPRRPRLFAAGGVLALQILIELTGNYGFFNVLAAALVLLLVDDAVWPRPLRDTARANPPVRWPRGVLPVLVVAYVALSLVPLAGAFRAMPRVMEPLTWIYGHVAPFRSINGYGLFAVMTTERLEIRLQGSMDGVTWKDYAFRFKPGALNRPPPFAGPYMPRLDWQMWFAAMQDAGSTPWMGPFVLRLLEARPEVLALMERDPFEGKPPRYVRGELDAYRFTTFAERRTTGNWWRYDPRGIYFPAVSRETMQR